MVLVVTPSASTAGRCPVIHITGTIQEVIDELQNQNVKAGNVIFWTDNGTVARTSFCRFK